MKNKFFSGTKKIGIFEHIGKKGIIFSKTSKTKIMTYHFNLPPLIHLLCIGFLCMTNTLKAQVTESDSLELVNLYNTTNGANWTDNTNWLNAPILQWYGITLTNDGQNIRIIDLLDNNLSGTIPDLNLAQLETLNLAFNEISGTIPDLQNLPQLTSLYLEVNNLIGTIPNFDSPIIEEIRLYGNQLTGTIPSFENLISLQELLIGNNQLSGTIPNFILPNLTALDLGTNQLSGNLPDFNNLIQLEELYVNNNQLSGAIPDLTAFTTLRAISITNNQFTFEGLENNAAFFEPLPITNFYYDPQDTVIIEKACQLVVDAGGTLANNTYRWYKDDTTNLVIQQEGDNIFEPTESGIYFCEITNSIATELTLNTNAIEFEIENFVRPGDTNGDGKVNHYDLKNIGLAYGTTGIARIDQSIDFEEKCAEDWGECIEIDENCIIDYKHIDTNGNGEIEGGDINVIEQNFDNNNLGTEVMTTVAEIEGIVPVSSSNMSNTSLHVEVADSVREDEPIVFGIYWGSEQAPVDSVYSVAFTLTIELIDDENIVDSSGAEIPTLDISDSFLGDDLLEINKCFELDKGLVKWYIAITKTNQQYVAGWGLVAKAECIIPVVLVEGKRSFEDEKCFPLKFEFSDVKVTGQDGNLIENVEKKGTKAILVKENQITSIAEPVVDISTITLFPSPARDIVWLNLNTNFNTLPPTTVAIYNIQGQLIRDYKKVFNYPFMMNVSDLQKGMYLVEIRTSKHKVVKDLVVVK